MMIHPRFTLLARYAEGESKNPTRAKVGSHLRGCAACRATVAELRELAAAAASAPAPPTPAGALDRVLARRAAGERVILPTETATRDRRAPSRRWIGAAAAAVVAALALSSGLFLSTAELQADSSELRFIPDEPVAGQEVRVEYRASSLLAGEQRLVLRARYRTPRDEAYNGGMKQTTVGELRRGEGGVFRGSLQLPDSVVYAVFAVENAEGSRVDSNQRMLWDLLVSDGSGKPLAAALDQKSNDLHGRNWELAFRTAQQRARLYPGQVESWNNLYYFRRALFGDADSLKTFHRARFHRFEEQFVGSQRISADELGWMYWYSLAAGDSAVQNRWKARFLREAPGHPLAVQERAIEIPQKHKENPVQQLAALETLWDEVGPAHGQLLLQGLNAARRTGDAGAIQRWVERREKNDRRASPTWHVAEALATHPELREEGLRRFRAIVSELERVTPESRSLVNTVGKQRVENEAAQSRILAAVGQILLDAGRVRAGLDTLNLAMQHGWDRDVFARIADARFSVEDSLRAVDALANLVVDPGTERAAADSLTALGRRVAPPARWAASIETAHQRMRDRTLQDITTISVGGPLRLAALDGVHILNQRAAEDPLVVVFWSRHCGPALDALDEIQELADRLGTSGVQTIMIADEPPSSELLAFLRKRSVSVPVYGDTDGEIRRAFESWGTPEYFVLDASGRIRFAYSSLEKIPRQVTVLRNLQRQPAATDR